MKVLFLVNGCEQLVSKQSTTLLIAAAAKRHEAWVCGVDDLGIDHGRLLASARQVPAGDKTPANLVASLRKRVASLQALAEFDAIMIRTNPARDVHRLGAHEGALHFARAAAERGVVVVNRPLGLLYASTKLYLLELPPHVVPRMLVSRVAKDIEAWVSAEEGAVVLKPVRGTRGDDVFLSMPPDRTNLRQMISVLQRGGYVMAQPFVPGAEQGDIRVLVLDGHIIEVDGRPAAVARIPKGGDFRSNIHAGGTAATAVVSDEMRAAVDAIRPKLLRDGLFLVGIDFIGGKIIELNVFSPGGFGNAGGFHERDFVAPVIEALEQRVARHGKPAASQLDDASVLGLELADGS